MCFVDIIVSMTHFPTALLFLSVSRKDCVYVYVCSYKEDGWNSAAILKAFLSLDCFSLHPSQHLCFSSWQRLIKGYGSDLMFQHTILTISIILPNRLFSFPFTDRI